MKWKLTGLALTTLVLAFACSDSNGEADGDGHGEEGPCHEIEESCAPKDDGTNAEISECHEFGHDGTEAECMSNLDRCLTACGS